MRGRVTDRILRGLGFTVIGVAVLLILAPVALTVILSFADDPQVTFPPQSWGVDRYVRLAQSEEWLSHLWLSVRLALTTAVVSVVVAILALLGIHRTRMPFGSWLEQSSIVPMILPISAYAVAMYGVFADFNLLGSFHGLVIAHSTIAVPFVVLIVGASLRSVPMELELVAVTLGAPRVRAWLGITLRLTVPALFAGFVMAFQRSFEEAVFINFLGGPGLVTLPKAIYDSVQWGYDPIITAIAASIVIITSAVVAIPLALSRGRE
jgi:putative spermidine/putrescine transport system permease protein